MRVLIVGCGYVGLPLATELARLGHQVFGLRRSASSDVELQRLGITPLHADITQPATLVSLPRDFDWVVNCVASGGGGVDEYRQLYLEGMRNLIAWLIPGSAGFQSASSAANPTATRRQDAGAPRLVYTSSTGVYGQNDGSLVDETSPTEPASETARVLVEAEQVLLAAGREKHFPAMILRAAGIYGPGRGYLLKQFLRGEARIEGAGARTLNMIHRDDLIRAIIAALERGRAGELYNAVDDEPVSQLEFYQWLAAKLGKPLPTTMPEDAAAPRKRGLTNKRIANRKLKAELRFTFTYPDYRSGYSAEIERLRRENGG
jgi:nucleoside-diphosphate-sugar epimerase